ncbi:hypothetical protein ACFSJ3_06400 [Corallincola platygyrae]|uniref:Extradiol ring-cleavage dioxygenase LigAB LigA subunit domain-containing protein n=1 Tax=Corallincola platygyrae TaxID=1193278 RepID=A0ABW4XKM0_9GAMM
MPKLIDFMYKLGADAEFADSYYDAPEKVMKAAGLSEEERALVLAKNVAALEQMTGMNAKANPDKTIKSYAQK